MTENDIINANFSKQQVAKTNAKILNACNKISWSRGHFRANNNNRNNEPWRMCLIWLYDVEIGPLKTPSPLPSPSYFTWSDRLLDSWLMSKCKCFNRIAICSVVMLHFDKVNVPPRCCVGRSIPISGSILHAFCAEILWGLNQFKRWGSLHMEAYLGRYMDNYQEI